MLIGSEILSHVPFYEDIYHLNRNLTFQIDSVLLQKCCMILIER